MNAEEKGCVYINMVLCTLQCVTIGNNNLHRYIHTFSNITATFQSELITCVSESGVC